MYFKHAYEVAVKTKGFRGVEQVARFHTCVHTAGPNGRRCVAPALTRVKKHPKIAIYGKGHEHAAVPQS